MAEIDCPEFCGMMRKRRQLTKLSHILALLFLILGGPLEAQAGRSRNEEVAPPAATPVALRVEAATSELRSRMEAAERRNSILEAKAELRDDDYVRFEIWMGALVAFFSALITAIVIFFAIRTRAEAIAAAVPAAKEGVKDLREEIARQVEQGKAELEALRGHSAEAREMYAEAQVIIGDLKSGQAHVEPEERKTMEAAAQAANETPPALRTAKEIRSLIDASLADEEWATVLDHAQALAYFYGQDEKIGSHALFDKAYAFQMLDQMEAALAAYEELLTRYAKSDNPALRGRIASTYLNKGVALGSLGRNEEAINIYESLLERFDGDEPTLQRTIEKALFNKGNRYLILAMYDEAITAFRTLISRFGEEPVSPNVLALAYYGLAAGLARKKLVKESVEALKNWQATAGSFDCAKVRKDRDFDPVRDTPEFRLLMDENGCLTEI